MRLAPHVVHAVDPLDNCSPTALRSRGSTKRTLADPEGDLSAPSVRQGNLILGRTLVLLWVAASLGVWWVLEQPVGSLMQEHPAMREFMRFVRTYRKHIYMGDYGGETKKPTWLYSGRLFYV